MIKIQDWELSRLAHLAIVKEGLAAPQIARIRAMERLERLDLDGAHQWSIVSRRARLILSRMSRALH
ncbi:MAG TPA: hypothetical protein VGD66_03650 [Allosphingosinicella sp.]